MNTPASKILNRLKAKFRESSVRKEVISSVQLLHGPAMTYLADDQIALIIVGRDVGYFLEHQIRHHLALGVSHVVYIDNGSGDGSVEIARQFPNITIARCTADFKGHQKRIRHLANTRFVRGGWRLAIDPDELLDYPGANRIDLPELTRRMTARGHSALVAQMLDMVPDGPVSAMSNLSFSTIEQRFDRYSLNDIKAFPYHGSSFKWSYFLEKNRISNPDIPILFGGIRHAAFKENCCLTKHALFRMGKGITPHPHPHVTTGVTCTDFSALLKHYKFAGGTLEREKKLLAENRISHGEMKLRVTRLEREHDLDLSRYAECRHPTVEKLMDQGFLNISDAALKMLS